MDTSSLRSHQLTTTPPVDFLLNNNTQRFLSESSSKHLNDLGDRRLIASLDLRGVCQRQVEELSEQLPAIGVRVVLYPSGSDGQQIIDGSRNSSRLEDTIPAPQELAALLNGKLEVLKLTPITQYLTNRDRLQSVTGSETAYIFSFGSSSILDEYLLLVTSFPLAPCEQTSAMQRAHLLRDYLIAHRFCIQRQDRDWEQTIRQVEHQLRNPLAAIELFAETLCLRLPPGELRQQAESIQKVVEDLGDRLQHMLCLEPECVAGTRDDLREILLDTIAMLKPSWEAKYIRIDVPEQALSFPINRSQIKQVFENLLKNAIYFSPNNSTITCNWKGGEREVLVEIGDRGPGLAPEELNSAFLPYFSRREGGTGLGLTIARSFVRQHNGDMWCQNLPEGGARFSFTLKHPATDYSSA